MSIDEDFLEIADAFMEVCWECRRRGENVPAATWRKWEAAKAAQKVAMLVELDFLVAKRIRAKKQVSAIVAIEMFLKKRKCS